MSTIPAVKKTLPTLTGVERVQYIKYFMLMYMPKNYTDAEIEVVLPKLETAAKELAITYRVQVETIVKRAIGLFF
jgi:hypothetical protein